MDIILWHKILTPYEQAVNELLVKFNYLRRELLEQGYYCPIEHVMGRVKSISGILDKMQRKGIPLEKMEEEVDDIAGIRLICQFKEDIERISKMISQRSDIEVLEVKDYVTNRKESGYRSYHLVTRYTVNTMEGPKPVIVEIQIRTMAMDFWATVEHSMQYKYQGHSDQAVGARLTNAANAIIRLDDEMSAVREVIMDVQVSHRLRNNLVEDIINTIEGLYRQTSVREVKKIQEEFYRIYNTNDSDELQRYHDQLDEIAQGYRAQINRPAQGIKKTAE